ncbi:MAG: phenylacetate--CoA ligase [Bacteroidales bacterium]|nr:phenylacetate--CoA ligase [Bacteroidales bacterium]
MNRYWEEELETMSRPALEKLQLERLKTTFAYAARSPYYKQLFGKLNLTVDSFGHIDDIRKIPFTTKEDLRANYPYGLVALPLQESVRLHSSSGTTGNPTVIFHSQHDLDSWSNLVARCLYSVGVRDTDVFQNTSGYGMFTGGLGFQYGAERLGCLTIPAAAGNSRRQIKFMQDFGTTTVHAIPSYAIRLADVFEEMGLDPHRDTRLKTLVIGAEPHTEEQRRRIEELLGVRAFNSFGMSEMSGPGVAFECEYQTGLHLWEDAFYLEIIHPDTLEPLPDGEIGELVLTSLDRRAMPILRYRTRDLTRILPGDCPCRRVHRRIDRVKGRTDDMFIIKGCNIFPMQIEKILLQTPEVGNNYMITLDTVDHSDEMLIEVELKDLFTDDYGRLENLAKSLRHRIRDEVLVAPRIKLAESGSLPQSEGKAVRVRDLRNNK